MYAACDTYAGRVRTSGAAGGKTLQDMASALKVEVTQRDLNHADKRVALQVHPPAPRHTSPAELWNNISRADVSGRDWDSRRLPW